MKPLPTQSKPLVVALRQTCGACPAQWEGETEDGQAVYIRYRHGHLSVGIGFDHGDAIDNGAGWTEDRPPLFSDDDGTGGGWMDEAEMQNRLAPVLDFQRAATS